jgi:hypothetical protein
MKRMLLAMAVTTLLMTVGLISSDSAQAGRIGDRQVHQHARIDQGVADGQLTRGETHTLRDEQRAIRTSKRAAWSDGHLTPQERGRMERMQDRASADIYRLKHNGRTP